MAGFLVLLALRMRTKGIRPNGKKPYERTDATILVPVFLSGNRLGLLAYRYICNEPDLPPTHSVRFDLSFLQKADAQYRPIDALNQTAVSHELPFAKHPSTGSFMRTRHSRIEPVRRQH